MHNGLTSDHLFARALARIPGGVNSPVRAFKGVGGTPVFIARAEGAYLYDTEGRAYVDCVGSWGPMILGHNHPAIRAAVEAAVPLGLSFGAPCPAEVEMAETIHALMPNLEKVRMVNSGTEATMSALRLARAYTQRPYCIKFEGCYHGHADPFLVQAGSGALTCGSPSSPGIPEAVTSHTLIAQYNDLSSVAACLEAYPQAVAAIIVEPIAGNMNCVPPVPGFLEGLTRLAREAGALLIFDEVMTGFRVGLQGAQGLYGIQPDLTTLGKIIGGGMPVGAFGGRAEIMDQLAPAGPVYQAGTLSGNPIAMHAGLACLQAIQAPDVYPTLETRTHTLLTGLQERAQHYQIPFTTQHVGSFFGLFFTHQPVITTFQAVQQCDQKAFQIFFHHMLRAGVYLAPSAYEAGFLSTAHGPDEIAQIWRAAEHAFAAMQGL